MKSSRSQCALFHKEFRKLNCKPKLHKPTEYSNPLNLVYRELNSDITDGYI